MPKFLLFFPTRAFIFYAYKTHAQHARLDINKRRDGKPDIKDTHTERKKCAFFVSRLSLARVIYIYSIYVYV